MALGPLSADRAVGGRRLRLVGADEVLGLQRCVLAAPSLRELCLVISADALQVPAGARANLHPC